jgi:hypothetical protein
MLSKEERTELNRTFWAGFKKLMNSYKSSNGRSINWLNYPSDVKGIFIRMEVDNKAARLCFDIQFKDEGIRGIVWEQMGELKKILESTMQHESIWLQNAIAKEGFVFSRICWELNNVSIYNPDNIDAIYSFLQSRIIEFDKFYQEFKDILISLVH